MTEREELERLAERVERLSDDRMERINLTDEIDELPIIRSLEPMLWGRPGDALRGSLDACAELHKAVLGEEWGWTLNHHGLVTLYREMWRPVIVGVNGAPARAWLSAILRAKAKEGGND